MPRIPVLLIAASLVVAGAPTVHAQQQPADTAKDRDDAGLPLQPGDTLRFTTDEGTWISLDVSPDGRTIVFDLLGDLYTIPIEGGRATRITRGMAFDATPRFSPDGERIVFVSDRSGGENLWTLDLATGDTTQVTKGDGNSWVSPDWTPDGEYIVASRGETRLGVVKLWIGHVEGGRGIQLHEEPENLKTVGAAVSPDGRWIWYARRTGAWQYNAEFPQYQLAVYDRETGEDYTRTSRYGSGFRPAISPDGRWLAYGSRYEDRTGLRIRDLETGEERWLHVPVQRDDMESIADRDALPGFAFTPDSREVVISYDGGIWRLPVEGGDPVRVPFSADVELPVGPKLSFSYPIPDSAQFTVRQIRDAMPSPDGSRLAFIALDRLYLMDWPNGQPRRVTDADVIEAMPAWSPDGEWIAYVTWSGDGGHIMKVRANGGQPVQLTTRPAMYQQPAFSPDGSRIAAVRGPARAYIESTGPTAPGAADDLIWIPADGGDAALIAPTNGRSQPHFREGENDRIYLFAGRDGLVSIRWDGTDPKGHVKVVGNTRPGSEQPNTASLIRMAPEGNRALALVNTDVYVVTVPYVGGETPTVNVSNPDNAIVPARKLTQVGGQFPAWSADGERVHWSIGNAHFVYDLERARAVEDSVEAAQPDTASDEDAPAYEPQERRIVVRATRDIPQGTAVLRGGRVITMNGDEVIENADIVVRNNRIAAVGPQGEVDVPAGAEVIDVAGTTIVPGFVDTHAHMWPAWGIHKPQIWMYLTNLAYGVTTTRDPQTSTTDVITYGDLVDAGEMIGPRVFSTGPGVFGDYQQDPIRDLDHARDILRRYSEYYDTRTIKMYMAGNRQQRQWIAMAAREQQLMPTTEGGLKMMYDLTIAMDGYSGLEHSLPIYPIYQDVVELFTGTGIAYTPTLLVSYGGPWAENYYYALEDPHDNEKLRRFTPHEEIDAKARRRNDGWFMDEEYVFEDHAEGVRKIVEAGGRAGIGGHGQLQGLGYHWELWSVQSGGMSEHDALRAATIMGAEAIGVAGDLGSVQAGKLADLVILNANPLDDIRNTTQIRYVMKNGRLYDGDTLDEIWPRRRPLERQGWIVAEPEVEAGAVSR